MSAVLRLEVRSRDIQEFDIGGGRDVTLDLLEHLPEPPVALGDHRHGARRPLPAALAAGGHWAWWSTSATDSRYLWRSPSTMGLTAPRFAFSERLSGTCRSKQTAAACTTPLSRAGDERRASGQLVRIRGRGRGGRAPPARGSPRSSGGRRRPWAWGGAGGPGR